MQLFPEDRSIPLVLDTESASPNGPVISMAVVNLRTGEVLMDERFGLPAGADWNWHSEKVHGITRQSLKGLTSFRDSTNWQMLFHGRTIIGHNIASDVRLMEKSIGYPLLFRRTICTLRLARDILGLQDKLGLAELHKHLADVSLPDIPIPNMDGSYHDALTDTLCTRLVYLRLRAISLQAQAYQ